MSITRDNYEPFFLDYLEGNLNENMIDQFLEFLEQNPDLKEELTLFSNIQLPDEQVVFQNKAQLHKSPYDEKSAFDNRAIAYLENDLKNEERRSFETYISQHAELQREYNLFSKTRLIADSETQYPDKQKLYRKSGITIAMKWAARAAAVIAIVWSINTVLQTENITAEQATNQQIAAVKPALVTPDMKKEPVTKVQQIEIQQKQQNKVNHQPTKNQQHTQIKGAQNTVNDSIIPERDLTKLEEITPILAQLESEPIDARLVISGAINTEKINDPRNIMTIEEFVASRVKKVGNNGMSSVQRIFRTGLSVASELSGERIGYKTENGKITSLHFDSKLLAFSIPLQKK